MKKSLLNFAEKMLSKKQMQSIKGGQVYVNCSTIPFHRVSGTVVCGCDSYLDKTCINECCGVSEHGGLE
jgi:hypothetical protein